jgi:hypothetical protein
MMRLFGNNTGILMRWPERLWRLCLAAACVHTGYINGNLCAAAAVPLTITVDINAPNKPINSLLFGVFLDDRDFSIDGGLYAELVKNRSFEDRPDKNGWLLERGGDWDSSINLDRSKPLNPQNTTSLRWEIVGGSAGRMALVNTGYWGISIEKGEQYRWSLHARRNDAYKGSLVVSVEDSNGKTIGQGKTLELGLDWERFEGVITAGREEKEARLAVKADRKGVLWLDQISLFPVKTWANRTNGMRADLAGMIRDLRPAFVRFPGGRSVTGDSFANAYRWKQTMGALELRPGLINPQENRSSDVHY